MICAANMIRRERFWEKLSGNNNYLGEKKLSGSHSSLIFVPLKLLALRTCSSGEFPWLLVTRLQIDCRPKTANIPRGKISSGANIPLATFPWSRYSSFLTAVSRWLLVSRPQIDWRQNTARPGSRPWLSQLRLRPVKYLRRCLIIATFDLFKCHQ